MSDRVSKWLQGLGLEQYAGAFEENAVESEILPELTDDDLKELGINALGHRKTILKAINALLPDETTLPLAAETRAAAEPTPEEPIAEDMTAWSRTPGERKPVTMLFADIVGSTALTEALDAEDAHDLLYRATQHMCQAVESNRGTVCRFMGDGIMAMFGAPVSSERHALEACCAALEMQAKISKYARDLRHNNDVALQIRVGLNSGEVVVLEVGDDSDKPEYDASGPTVPLAARMEQSAEAGTILVTETTRNLAGSLIETNKRPAISVKGVSEPVSVYQLKSIRSASEVTAIADRKPMVGRKSELAQFHGLMQTCLDSGNGQTVFVRGEAGIGKSRLVEEISLLARERGFECHKALVLDFGSGKGQGAIPTLVRSLLGIAPGSGKRERKAALDRAENDGIVESNNRLFLNDLLDLAQPPELRILYDAMEQQVRKEGKRAAVMDMLVKLAARNSILIIVEDLHWADSIALDYLARLAIAVAQCTALMVLTSRAEGDPLDSTWRASAGESPIVTWDLSPLRQEEAIKLVSAFIDAGDSLARRCIERAAGNPLFLEQLLLSVEKGVSESVPDSIKSLVLARMDQLSSADKQALQAAAVLGQRFDLDGLRYLVDQPDYECSELVERHLVRPEGPLYLFAHALIREGAYASLLKTQRLELHRQAARWYTERDAVLQAEHLDQAGDAAAVKAYLNAAEEQSQLNRLERALQLVRRGLEIATEAERYALQCLEGKLLRHSGLVNESIEAYRHSSKLAGDDIDLCRALVGIAEGLALKEALDELVDVLKNAEELASVQALTWELARIFQLRGGQLFFGSDTEACLEANQTALKYAREADAPELEAQALSGLGDTEYSRGRFKSAKRYFTQCIEIARKHGYGRVLAANLPMLSEVNISENDFTEAKIINREAIELATNTRDLRSELMALTTWGWFQAETDDPAEGEKSLRRALDIANLLGSKNMQGMCLGVLANVNRFKGDRKQAARIAQKAVDVLRTTDSGMTFYGPYALGLLALVTDDINLRQGAMEEAEKLLTGYCVSHNYFGYYESAMDICLEQANWDEVDRYAQALHDYTRAEPMPRYDFLIICNRALANHGRGKRDQATITELQNLYEEAQRLRLKRTLPALEAALANP